MIDEKAGELTEAERDQKIRALVAQINELRDMQPTPPWARWIIEHYPDLKAEWPARDGDGRSMQALRLNGFGMSGAVYSIELRPRSLPVYRAIVALLEAVERGEVQTP